MHYCAFIGVRINWYSHTSNDAGRAGVDNNIILKSRHVIYMLFTIDTLFINLYTAVNARPCQVNITMKKHQQEASRPDSSAV